MKLTILQENLSKAVSITSRFTSSKAQLPVLANLHLKTNRNKLLINATNLELSISTSLGAQIKEEGEITVPARTFSDIITNLSNRPISLEIEKEQLQISSENFSSTVSVMNASDFPKVPTTSSKGGLELPGETFISTLKKILFSVSGDETRPALTGVLMKVKKNILELVATDGFRLSQKKLSISNSSGDFAVIIPKSVLQELTKLFEGEESLVFVYNKDENQVVFSLPGFVLASRVIEADFPPYEKIIPKSSSFEMDVDKEEFLRAVKLSSVFARDSANVIKINLKKSGVDVLSESKTAGSQKTFVDAKSEGEVPEEHQIAFNFRFLEEVIGVIEADSLGLGFSGSNAPGVFKDSEDKDYLHLIMPVKIQA